jgi:hypothetical protein|nr:hypothetical protein [uncultured Emticicia sp.]
MYKKYDEWFFLIMNGFLKSIFICMIFSMFLHTYTYAQVDNINLENNQKITGVNVGKVQFNLNSLIYIKNNEYFNEIADGYTLIGYYINPTVAYRLHKKVQIDAGLFVRKEYGYNGLKEIEPTFTVQIKQKDWRFLFGNIEGNINHRLIEPLMTFERVLIQPLEHGFQAKFQRKDAYFDGWLDWQQTTIAGKTNQERIWAGASFFSQAASIKDIKFQALAQASVFHIGGQNIQTLQPVRTFINPAVGLRVKKNFGKNQSLTIDNYYVGYFESPLQGTAYYLNTFWKNTNYQVGFNYWFGSFFNSPFGNDLMQSTSRKFNNASYYENIRSLLILRLVRDWKISEKVKISLRVEPYYDLNNRIFEHSEGLYLSCKL